MANTFRKFERGVVIVPESSDPAETNEGQLSANSSSNFIKAYIGGALRQLVTDSQSQLLSNKKLQDSTTSIVDNADNTKEIKFDAGGTASTSTTITAAQTANRVVTLPDATDTLVGRNTSDSLTNKTISALSNTISDLADSSIGVGAAIARSKLASGTADHVLINNGSGVMSSEATLAKSRGGSGQDNSSLTFPASGTLATVGGSETLQNKNFEDATTAIVDSVDPTKKIKFDAAGTTGTDTTIASSQTANRVLTLPDATDTLVGKDASQALTNKTIDATLNTLSNISNTEIAAAAAIARSKLATGSANHVVINAGDGSFSSEATLAKSRGGSGQDNSSLTFPATGTLATLAGTESLSNKTFSDATTHDQIATPSSPAAGKNKLYFKSDGNLYRLDSSGTEVKVGSGSGFGGKNYITNPDAEQNVNGWSAYADAAGVAPVNGTGGSPTVTITRTTSTPLRETGSFLITKDAANRQGEGVSVDFTIDEADKATMLQVSFDYVAASGFVSGDSSDIRVWVYDVTNSRLINVLPLTIQTGATYKGHFKGSFQSSADSTSYRLIMHVATTNATAWTFKYDNVYVGPQALAVFESITDWVDGSSQVSPSAGFGTVTNSDIRTRRVGDTLHCKGSFKAGTTAASSAYLSLSNIAIDTSKISATTQHQAVGTANLIVAAGVSTQLYSTNNGLLVFFDGSDATKVFIGPTSASNVIEKQNVNFFATSNDSITFEFSIPVAGWGVSTVASTDATVRTVAARATTASGQSIATATDTKVDWDAISYDTHGAFDIATNDRFTAPVSGKYRVSAAIEWAVSGTGFRAISIRKNGAGSPYSYLDFESNPSGSNTEVCTGSDTIDLSAGDYIEIYAFQNSGGSLAIGNSGGQLNYVAIERLPNAEYILPSETVSAKYAAEASQSLSSGSITVIDCEAKKWDTHAAVTTGASWKFTAPISGIYSVQASITYAADVNGYRYLAIHKNGTAENKLIRQEPVQTGSPTTVAGSTTIDLLAGEYIDLRGFQNSGSSLGINGSAETHIVITRVGGI